MVSTYRQERVDHVQSSNPTKFEAVRVEYLFSVEESEKMRTNTNHEGTWLAIDIEIRI